MDITSIDNCYEDDGLTLVYGFLAGLNAEKDDDPERRRLVAITPEYDAAGRLQRLNCVTVLAKTPPITPALLNLTVAADAVADERKRDDDAALAKLDAADPIAVVTFDSEAGR